MPLDVSSLTARHRLRFAILLGAMLIVSLVYLRWQGRVWWCAQRDFSPISLQTWSPHNSQHLLDAYSLSHVLHGVAFFGLLWFFRRQLTYPTRLLLATAIELAWELLENSPIIIDRYRAATVSLGYEGDSIVNTFGDVLSSTLGFWIAGKLGLWKSIVFWIVVEVALLIWIRDNLALNILMLIRPIDAIKQWQSGAAAG